MDHDFGADAIRAIDHQFWSVRTNLHAVGCLCHIHDDNVVHETYVGDWLPPTLTIPSWSSAITILKKMLQRAGESI